MQEFQPAWGTRIVKAWDSPTDRGEEAMSTVTARMDDKGRLAIPREMREELNLVPGSTVFLKLEGGVLQMAKAEDPFEVLARGAEQEYRQGRTRSLRDYARANEIQVDG
jgi:bifunctional DNA-binding transcriptional regulator/antitoxin component of YhaV-PrlF toxin-antitoxin module